MSTIGKRTIYAGPAGSGKPLNIEGVALEAVAPGTVVEQTATGIQANAAAATVFGQELIVADKDQQRSKSVDDAWTIGENMVAIKVRSGERLNALVATGQAISTKGTPLSLNGAGLLKIAVTPASVGTTSEQVLAFADEIITTTETTLVRVRVA